MDEEQQDYSVPIEVFCSYAHRDEDLKILLLTHLAPMERGGIVTAWHDGDLSAGEEWQAEIEQRLNTCEVILLLISPDFFASDFCYGTEMQRALARHDNGDAIVVPIIARPCDWQSSPVGRLQALPPHGKPVTSWSSRDEAMEAVAKGLRKVLSTGIRKDQKQGLHPSRIKYGSGLLPPRCTAVEGHSTSGASVITIGKRPQVKGVQLGPVDLEFELTNANPEEMSVREIYVEVIHYEEAQLLRRIPLMGLGQTRRYLCTVQPNVGQAFKCASVKKGHDFIKLSKGELERFRITVDATSGGVYRLAVILRYSSGGEVTEIKLGGPEDLAFLGRNSDVDGMAHLMKALDDPELTIRRDAALELCEYSESMERFGTQPWGRWIDDASAVSCGSKPSPQQLLPILIAILEDPDEWVRGRAAKFLGQLGDAAAVPALAEAFRLGRLGYEATEALGQIGIAALPTLANLLKDPEVSRRCRAVQALGDIGTHAIPHLNAAILDQDENVRRVAAESLGKVGGDDAVRALAALLHDVSESVRSTAASQLGNTKNPAAIRPLRDSLKSGNTRAAQALTNLNPPDVEGLMFALASTEPNVKLAATSALGNLSWLFTQRPGTSSFGGVLAELQKTTLGALESALADDLPSVRRLAAKALAQIGSPAMTQLGLALRDMDADTHKSAAWALEKMGVSALPTLIDALDGPDEAHEVLFLVFYRLGQPAIDSLQRTIEDGDAPSQRAAAAILERINAKKASDELMSQEEGTKLPCERCNALILPATARKTGGLCMPCYKAKLGTTN